MKKRVNWFALIICLGIMLMISLLGSSFNYDSGWYEGIKPSITPPNFVFPIVWGILYILIGLAIYFTYTNKENSRRKTVLWFFALNLLANVLWSFFFFGLHRPILAFFDILILLLSIIFIMMISYKKNKITFWLLLPYLIWVCFATL